MSKRAYRYIIIMLLMFALPTLCFSYPNTSVSTIDVDIGPTSCALAKNYLFVANSKSSSVSVIDLNTNTVTETIDVGASPYRIIASPDQKYIYVSNFDDRSVSVISVDSLTVTATITDIGDGPFGMYIPDAGDNLYVVCKDSDAVTIISIPANTIKEKVLNIGIMPDSLVVDPLQENMYVTLTGKNSVAKIDLTDSNKDVINEISVGSFPEGIAYGPNKKNIYVANSASNSISVVNVNTNTVEQTINKVGDNTNAIAVMPNGLYAYVTSSNSNAVSVVDLVYNQVVNTITVETGPTGVCLSSDGKYAYIANEVSHTVSILKDESYLIIEGIDKTRINDSGTAQITWHTKETGTYQVEVGGDGVKDAGVVLESGDVIAEETNTTTITAATALLTGDSNYKIYFYFTAANGEEYSEYYSVTLDNQAPAVPTFNEDDSHYGDTMLYLSWVAILERDMEQYRLYYGTAPGVYDYSVDVNAQGSSYIYYTLSGLTNGTTYYMALSAIDTAGNESEKSAELSLAPQLALSLSNLKGEEGCYIATASSTEGKSSVLNRFIKTLNNLLSF